MESITFKVNDKISKEIRDIVKGDYSTKTEFIREAVRDKIKELRKKRALELLEKNFGTSKRHVSDEELERAGEIVAKKYLKKFNLLK